MSTAQPDLVSIGDALHRLTRTIHRRKAQLAAENGDSEWAAHTLLDQLVTSGPMRAAQLAESTFTDPSTISRHVAALVRDGLIERRADPVDGRASLLVTTDAGARTIEEQRSRRLQWLTEMLEPWPVGDRADFARLLDKFTLTLEAQSPASAVPMPVSEGQR